ncbi:hypothetical protein BDQ12DRAFT_665503 [Crucibulum laeve]|uniref:Uncharacterized protein n=1 Tax=Crucibulum laeve TaxID=68775 RepID=A0A5C3M5N9_9AGAR|nr:hypothetical protein BDQ12DRAFT_665503 [Crucibulum laeve]
MPHFHLNTSADTSKEHSHPSLPVHLTPAWSMTPWSVQVQWLTSSYIFNASPANAIIAISKTVLTLARQALPVPMPTSIFNASTANAFIATSTPAATPFRIEKSLKSSVIVGETKGGSIFSAVFHTEMGNMKPTTFMAMP